MTTPISTEASVTAARDVDIVCCTNCCPIWPRGLLRGRMVTHHRHPSPVYRDVSDLSIPSPTIRTSKVAPAPLERAKASVVTIDIINVDRSE